MKEQKIKTDWASAKLTQNNGVVICAKGKNGKNCIRFDKLTDLKQAIKSKKISVKKWIISVPFKRCIFKSLQLPAKELTEAAQMLDFEIPSLIPLPPEDLIYGCTLLNKTQGMLNVLVCIIRKSILSRLLEPYNAAAIYPNKVIFDSLAIQNFFNTVNKNSQKARLDIFAAHKSCYIISSRGASYQKADEIAYSNTNFRDEFLNSNIFANEISNQKTAAKSENNNIDISLAGLKQPTSKIKDILQENWQLLPVNKLSFFRPPAPHLFLAKNRCGGAGVAESPGSPADSLIAAGLLESIDNANLQYINLLPRDDLKKAQRKSLLLNYLATGILSAVLILLIWLTLAAMNWRIEEKAEKIMSKIAPIENVAGSVESKRELLKAVQLQLANRGYITKIFQELYKFSPKAISISNLKLFSESEKTRIEINGQADTLSNAFEYSNAMKKAQILNAVQITNAQQIPRPGGSVVEFQAECVIKEIKK